ncbi:MAG: hypothetical protein JWM42_359 [Burkholderia sp.]|jgi:hypothetical protein|nr:hypothetical protein [Burkholderia sp.]
MRCLSLLACIPLLLASCGGGEGTSPMPEVGTRTAPPAQALGASANAPPVLAGGAQLSPPPTVTSASPAPKAPLNRAAVDQPDDIQGSQVHVIYAIPGGGVDRAMDLGDGLANSSASYNSWLAGQTGGRRLRFDTYQGNLDVTFARLPKTDADYDAFGNRKRDSIEADLAQLGMLKPNKIYAVYYDGNNVNTCADAPHPPGFQGQVAVLYLRGAVPGYKPCHENAFAASPDAPPGYLDFTMLHELLHTLGAVDDRAPNAISNGHVGTDPSDLMYAGPLVWNPTVLDFNKANYYNPNGLPNGIFNLAISSYLTP